MKAILKTVQIISRALIDHLLTFNLWSQRKLANESQAKELKP